MVAVLILDLYVWTCAFLADVTQICLCVYLSFTKLCVVLLLCRCLHNDRDCVGQGVKLNLLTLSSTHWTWTRPLGPCIHVLRQFQIGYENSSFLRRKGTISALEALRDALFKSTTTTTTTATRMLTIATLCLHVCQKWSLTGCNGSECCSLCGLHYSQVRPRFVAASALRATLAQCARKSSVQSRHRNVLLSA